ncbi:type II asparaginase [Solibacillus sp. FSL W7-1464]|uniref:type II asparaginase n=1 Tax=Solibacillus sp. FSL W7-1464 TaxID=2921706 RepID=UPI0030FA9494
MKKNNILKLFIALALMLSLVGFSAPSFSLANTSNKELPNIKILATGGTIASRAESETDTSNYSVADGIQSLIDAVPAIKDIANVSGEQLFNIVSSGITDEHRLILAKRINTLLAQDDVDGIVVTHGTDTLEQTAYFLNLVVKSNKPVVVVGAMRPASAISADGPLNLYNAVKVAGDKKSVGKGALIVMNDRIGAARFINKNNYWAVDTFKATEQGFIGDIVAGKVRYYQESLLKHTYKSEFDIMNLDELPKVDIIYGSYGQSDASMFNAAVSSGTKGIVLAGSVLGDLSDRLASYAKLGADKSNGGVVVSSFYQANGHSLYENADQVESNTLNPHKSRILLQLALTKTTDMEEIQKFFDEY